MEMFWKFCREEERWGCGRAGDVGWQGGVWLGGRGSDACCPEDHVPMPLTVAAALQKEQKRYRLSGRRRDRVLAACGG